MASRAVELIVAVAMGLVPLQVPFDSLARSPESCGIQLDVPAVVAISERVARQQSVRLEKYKLEDVTFDFGRKEWIVFFDEKPPGLSFDGCFRVTISDGTGEGEFRACP